MDVHSFLTLLADPQISDEEIWTYATRIFRRVRGDQAHLATLLLALATRIDCESNPRRRAMVALVAGRLVDAGGDPWAIARPVLCPIPEWMAGCNRLLDSCLDYLGPARPTSVTEWEFANYDDLGHWDETAEDKAFDDALEVVGRDLPEEREFWDALELISQPAVSLLSREAQLRNAGQEHHATARRLAEHNEGAFWLSNVYDVLDEEPVLLLCPAIRKGLLGSISGVADNMQLHMLLADASFRAGIFDRQLLPQRLIEIANGMGPQALDEMVEGPWDMYTWRGLRTDLRLPRPGDLDLGDHWIWSEGTPADIPLFDGYRVILIGPRTRNRSWPAHRRFPAMRAQLSIQSTLSDCQVNQWLNRINAEQLSGL